MTHDPRDVETAARLLADAYATDDNPIWEGWKGDAAVLLDALQAKGWKITSPKTPRIGFDVDPKWPAQHSLAPIVPRGEA